MSTIEADYISISKDQIQCLAWVARGKTCAEIAAETGRSPAEVGSILEQACRDLGVHGSAQAAIVCVEIGLI